MPLRKNTRISFMDCIHSPRAQALPSNTISHKNRRRWLSLQFFFFSLSLSLCPCSNELDHISDAVETPNSGQKLPATELLTPLLLPASSQSSLLLLYSPSKKTDFSSFFPVPRWLPPEAPSKFSNAVPFLPRAILSLVTFIIRASSMLAAMPN